MQLWRYAALPIALLASQGLAENWVAVAADDMSTSVDKDSIRRGSDGLVHFTTFDDELHLTSSEAAACQQRLIYFDDRPGWRDRGRPVRSNSFAEVVINYVCANAQ